MRACFIFSLIFLVVLFSAHPVAAQFVYVGAINTSTHCDRPFTVVTDGSRVFTGGHTNYRVCAFNSNTTNFQSSSPGDHLYGTNSMVITNDGKFVYSGQPYTSSGDWLDPSKGSSINSFFTSYLGGVANLDAVRNNRSDYLGNAVFGIKNIIDMVMTVDSPNSYLFAISDDSDPNQNDLAVFRRNTNSSDVNYGRLSFVQKFDTTAYPSLNNMRAVDIALGVVYVASQNALNFFYYYPPTNNYAFYGYISNADVVGATNELSDIYGIAAYRKSGPYQGSLFIVSNSSQEITPLRRTVVSGAVTFTKMPGITLPFAGTCKIKVSPDSNFLIASGCTGDNITVYKINSDLTLTQQQVFTGTAIGFLDLGYASKVSFSPDGKDFYSALGGAEYNTILHFQLDKIFANGFD